MNTRGQILIETILILALFLVVGVLVAAGFRQNDLLSQMVASPWVRLSGLLQNGVWLPPEQGAALHPSNHLRQISTEGDRPQ